VREKLYEDKRHLKLTTGSCLAMKVLCVFFCWFFGGLFFVCVGVGGEGTLNCSEGRVI